MEEILKNYVWLCSQKAWDMNCNFPDSLLNIGRSLLTSLFTLCFLLSLLGFSGRSTFEVSYVASVDVGKVFPLHFISTSVMYAYIDITTK